MAEIQRPYARKEQFGGLLGSRKTRWLAIVVTVSVVAAGGFYLLPQIW